MSRETTLRYASPQRKLYRRLMNQIIQNAEFTNYTLPIINVDTKTFKDLNTLRVDVKVMGNIDISKLHG